jgi:hypothetical protein
MSTAKKEDLHKIYEIPAFIKFLVKKGVLMDLYAVRGWTYGGNMIFIADQAGSGGEDVQNIELQVDRPLSWDRANGEYYKDPVDVPKRFAINDQITRTDPAYMEFDDLIEALKEVFFRIGKARGGEGKWAKPEDALIGLYLDYQETLR